MPVDKRGSTHCQDRPSQSKLAKKENIVQKWKSRRGADFGSQDFCLVFFGFFGFWCGQNFRGSQRCVVPVAL
jgi:hypothetical protein